MENRIEQFRLRFRPVACKITQEAALLRRPSTRLCSEIDDKARGWHSASPCGDRADVGLNTFDPLIPIGLPKAVDGI